MKIPEEEIILMFNNEGYAYCSSRHKGGKDQHNWGLNDA